MAKQYAVIYNHHSQCGTKTFTAIIDYDNHMQFESARKIIDDAKARGDFSLNVTPLKSAQVLMKNGYKAKLFDVDGVVYARFHDASSLKYEENK